MSGQRPSLPELLRVIAEEESLDRTLARFPGLSRTELVGVLLGTPPPSHPPPRTHPAGPVHPVQPHRKLRVASDGTGGVRARRRVRRCRLPEKHTHQLGAR